MISVKLIWFCALLLLSSQFHLGFSFFLNAGRNPILNYLVKSKVDQLRTSFLGVPTIPTVEVEHVHHFHFEPVPVLVAPVALHDHHHVAHKYGNDFSHFSSDAWHSHYSWGGKGF